MRQYNEHGFDEEGFLQEAEGNLDKMELLSNIVEYAQKNEHVSLDQFAYAVSDMTGIPFEEVLPYCADEILTKSSQEIKETMLLPMDAEFEKGFAKEAFLQYAVEYAESTEDILRNTLQELYKSYNVSKDQLAFTLSGITGKSFRETAKFCDDDSLTGYGRKMKEEAEEKAIALSIFSPAIQQEELRIAQELILFVRDYIEGNPEDYLGASSKQDAAASLEYNAEIKRFLQLLDPYSIITTDRQWEVDRAMEAGALMDSLCKLQQAQMEEFRGCAYTDKECLEITTGRAARDSEVPMVSFGRYTARNEATERGFDSTLFVGDTRAAVLHVDMENKKAVLTFETDKIPQKDIMQAYHEIDTSISVEQPRQQEERC